MDELKKEIQENETNDTKTKYTTEKTPSDISKSENVEAGLPDAEKNPIREESRKSYNKASKIILYVAAVIVIILCSAILIRNLFFTTNDSSKETSQTTTTQVNDVVNTTPAKINDVYTFSPTPNGYEKTKQTIADNKVVTTYKNDKKIIQLSQFVLKKFEPSIDTSNASYYKQSFSVGTGEKCTLYKKDDFYYLIFDKDGYAFEVKSNIDVESVKNSVFHVVSSTEAEKESETTTTSKK